MPTLYSSKRSNIRTGDVLLFRGKGAVSGFIRRATRSKYSHAGIALWVQERLMVAESKELHGVRLVPLSSALGLKQQVDVYRVMPSFDVDYGLVYDSALGRLGQPYGWLTILKHAVAWVTVVLPQRLLGKIPWVGGFLEKLHTYSEDDLEDPGKALVCSAFVAWCYRKGGLDLVRNLADAYTTPGDLARSIGLGLTVANVER